MRKELGLLSAGALALVGNATIVITGIAILTAYKDTDLIDNDTADAYITGLGYFGTFIALLVLVLMGSVIVGMVKGYMNK